MRKLLFSVLFAVVAVTASAQTAHWITVDDSTRNEPNTWIEFKKDLTLKKKVKKAEAKIAADSILVSGDVEGDLYANYKIEITSGSRVVGDISTLRLRIDDNVDFHGQVTMLEATLDVDIFSLTAAEYKKASTTFSE